MRVAIPLNQNRVAPRVRYAEELLVSDIHNGNVQQMQVLEMHRGSLADQLSQIESLDVRIILCSGIDRVFARHLQMQGISIIPNIIGKASAVLDQFANGQVMQVKAQDHQDLESWQYNSKT